MLRIWLAVALGLAGCATSMEELEAEASLTGDWSRVEARLEMEARRESAERQQRFHRCPPGMIAVRGAMGGRSCATTAGVRGMIEPRTVGR